MRPRARAMRPALPWAFSCAYSPSIHRARSGPVRPAGNVSTSQRHRPSRRPSSTSASSGRAMQALSWTPAWFSWDAPGETGRPCPGLRGTISQGFARKVQNCLLQFPTFICLMKNTVAQQAFHGPDDALSPGGIPGFSRLQPCWTDAAQALPKSACRCVKVEILVLFTYFLNQSVSFLSVRRTLRPDFPLSHFIRIAHAWPALGCARLTIPRPRLSPSACLPESERFSLPP